MGGRNAKGGAPKCEAIGACLRSGGLGLGWRTDVKPNEDEIPKVGHAMLGMLMLLHACGSATTCMAYISVSIVSSRRRGSGITEILEEIELEIERPP